MKSSIKIGRDNTNDVIINEPRVSRNHAIITILANGEYEVKDLGSSNGTYVNGQKITKQIINPGDKLQVASSIVDWQAAFLNLSSVKFDSIIQEEAFAKIKKTITIGSSDDNDIVLNKDHVSTHHAKISLLKNGNYYLQDMGSSNGSFVNGTKVIAKNFSKTDIVKIANIDLPNNWFQHKSLQLRFFKDHKKGVLASISTVLLIIAATLVYFNRCNWFGWDCNLSAKQMYTLNQKTLVHIDHEYYYTILVNGTKYYVGKNKNFTEQTEANTGKQNILPYNKISGNGCFIKSDGSILSSSSITNPWLNKTEQIKMLQEVIKSRTITGLTSKIQVAICGETAALKWIQNGVVNNQQNYTEANAANECTLTDSTTVIIQSIKKILPANAGVVNYSFNEKSDQHMHHTDEKYYGYFVLPKNNEMIKDTFYAAKDTFNINRFSTRPIADSLPFMAEGSSVFNVRGELIGIVQQQHVLLLQQFIEQIINH